MIMKGIPTNQNIAIVYADPSESLALASDLREDV
jgi:hypothetical protein